MDIIKPCIPQNNLFAQRGHTIEFIDSICKFFLYCLLVLHCMITSILTKMKKFFIELITRLPYNMTHQLVGHCWVTTTKVMNKFFF